MLFRFQSELNGISGLFSLNISSHIRINYTKAPPSRRFLDLGSSHL